MRISPFGGLPLRYRGRRLWLDLIVWRQGPWRLGWTIFLWGGSVGGHLETAAQAPLLQRMLADLIWKYAGAME
ncbi:hypothetical protein SE17_00110 [Kouleothrix aurantiaca]|uniref:Uncharacterized protein n=1 Tax=Kouleothrix aurantiaca TaxID=186479 RepID=A0A0P9DHP7_9CHLR|nr:hypothetical protein SE17_00110 [Kouleothrix aurantiaca]